MRAATSRGWRTEHGPKGARIATIASRTRLRLPVVSAAIIGLVWSMAAFWLVWRWEDTLAQNELRSAARSHLLAVQNGLNEYLAKLTSLQALFEASEHVTRGEFKTFTGRLLHNEKAIQNFSWAPRVTNAERPALEQTAVRDGIPGYRIKAVSADDKIGVSPERDEYLPIFYSSVRENTSAIYGIDLLSQPLIQQRLDRARDNNELSVVPDFMLHSVAGKARGFLFSLPIYRPDLPYATVEDRRRNLQGFVHGAFLTEEAFEHIITTGTNPQGLDLYLFGANPAPDAWPLLVHSSRLRALAIEAAPLRSVIAGRYFTDTLSAGDARWTFVAVPILGGPLDIRHDRAWLVLATSLLIGIIAVFYIRMSSRHGRRLLLANEQISVLAQTDALTGLMNRRAFTDRLNASFAGCQRGGAPFALLSFDLDHFKDVNDTLGHPTGDLLLRRVAQRVAGALRKSDAVARLGGDEFAVLQPNVSDSAPESLARKINEMLAYPFVIDGNEVRITTSIGIALYAHDIPSPDALMVQADLALYRAKEDGRDCFRFHSEALDLEVHNRVTLAGELRAAIDRGDLRLHYQPQVELATGRIIGVEALVRWQHPQRGLLGPSEFIPVAERTGSIAPLGQWVFEEECRQHVAWHRQDLLPGPVAVNFSAVQLKANSNLAGYIASTLAHWSLDPQDMEVELTESVLMEVSQQHSQVFESLRRLGIRITIDDFGTGYSSLKYLTSYPVNRLKIAQDLVFGVTSDARNATVVRAAVRLARDLGIECIAEGVETKAQVDFLVSVGCEFAQGYYFGRPVSAERMTYRLKQEGARQNPTGPRSAIAFG